VHSVYVRWTCLKITACWDVTLCVLLHIHIHHTVHSTARCCLHLQGSIAALSSEMSVHMYQSTCHHLPPDSDIHSCYFRGFKIHTQNSMHSTAVDCLTTAATSVAGRKTWPYQSCNSFVHILCSVLYVWLDTRYK